MDTAQKMARYAIAITTAKEKLIRTAYIRLLCITMSEATGPELDKGLSLARRHGTDAVEAIESCLDAVL